MKEKERFKLNLQSFADGEEENEPEVDELGTLKDLIVKQKEQLKNAVSKEEYDGVMKQNAQLQEIILNGGNLPNVEEKNETIDIQEAIDILQNKSENMTNLEYVKNALKYRKGVLEQKGIDVFAPIKSPNNPEVFDDDDYVKARRVADVLQQCVDECNGDSGVFTALLQSRMNDVSNVTNRNKRR